MQTFSECEYNWRIRSDPKVIGWDIEPEAMARVRHEPYPKKFTSDLMTVAPHDVKPHLWYSKSEPEVTKQTLEDLGNESFVAALEQGTSTGVLREHTMRLNSSLECAHILRSQLPSPCSGDNPFKKSFSHGNSSARICVPGSFVSSPWSLSRNRQDISEEFFLDILLEDFNPEAKPYGKGNNFTLHCTASTTRGYFELGNYQNNYTWGSLLETWPSEDEMRTEFNDVIFDYKGNDIPLEL
jgi:hypothetical protein